MHTKSIYKLLYVYTFITQAYLSIIAVTMLRFGTKQKSPREIFRSLRTSLESFPPGDSDSKRIAKIAQDVTKNLVSLAALVGGPGQPQPASLTELPRWVQEHGFLTLLVASIKRLTSEGRKAMATLFSTILQWEVDGEYPVVEYIDSNPEVINPFTYKFS